MRKSLYGHCVENNRTERLSRWDEGGESAADAADLSYGSKQKAAWHCEKGHEWRAQLWSRTGNRSGGSVCAGKVRTNNRARYQYIASDTEPRQNRLAVVGADPPLLRGLPVLTKTGTDPP